MQDAARVLHDRYLYYARIVPRCILRLRRGTSSRSRDPSLVIGKPIRARLALRYATRRARVKRDLLDEDDGDSEDDVFANDPARKRL